MQTETRAELRPPALIEAPPLDRVFDALHEPGYAVVRPTGRQDAIMVAGLGVHACDPAAITIQNRLLAGRRANPVQDGRGAGVR
jgi:hypothetical protein